MSSATEAPRRRIRKLPAQVVGGVCASAGVVLLLVPGVMWAAIGVELMALAFWLWARALPDRAQQTPRWAWLRRPAMALWLATALTLVLPSHAGPQGLATVLELPQWASPISAAERDPLAMLRALKSLAVLWAGLELLAALPLSRPYPDQTGPLPAVGPWLTAMLPGSGFLVLWRQSVAWSGGPLVREIAAAALLFATALAVLRAYSRRSLTASLRWLVVFDSALAALLLAVDAVPGEVAALLWLAAAGGRLTALAAELRGSAVRRGPELTFLWRLAGWTASASLAWPLLVTVGFARARFHAIEFVLLAAPVFLAARLSLSRVVEAPERRASNRPDPLSALSRAGAIMTMLLGPVALSIAWWRGFEGSFPGVAIAMLPALLAWWRRPRRNAPIADVLLAPVAAGASARDFALKAFRAVTAFESRLARALASLARALGAPARDLHSGDAQEYLLFLVGISVLALLLPLLR
ncbi:MAG: hypothetical protein ABIU54_10985 [Candidatus Eisenbacteria bacterium]